MVIFGRGFKDKNVRKNMSSRGLVYKVLGKKQDCIKYQVKGYKLFWEKKFV